MALQDFSKKLFSELSASAADPADTNTLFKVKQRIPKVLKEKPFFDQNLVDSSRIVKQGNLFYVPISKANFRLMTTNFIENNFIPAVAAQLSGSFNDKFTLASLPDDVVILGEDGPEVTASLSQDKIGGIGVTTITFTDTSLNAGGATHSFAFQQINGLNHEIYMSEFTESFSHLFNPNTLSGSSLTDNANTLTASGSSPVGVGTTIFVNGTDESNGSYVSFQMKSKIFGDGDETTFNSKFTNTDTGYYIGRREFIFFKDDIQIASGGFLYHPVKANFVENFGTESVLYWPISASNSTILPYSGSTIAGTLIQSGTLLYSDATLTTAANSGFYYPTGRRFMVGDYNNTTDLVFGARVQSETNGKNELVPRIHTASFTPQL